MSESYTATVTVTASTPAELAELLEVAADRIRRQNADSSVAQDAATGAQAAANGEGSYDGSYSFTVTTANQTTDIRNGPDPFASWVRPDED